MDQQETKEFRPEEERILTLKISLEGPPEVVSWLREMGPSRIGKRLLGGIPSEFRKHMRASRREQLLAMRSLIDAMIARLEREERPPKQAVEVEIE